METAIKSDNVIRLAGMKLLIEGLGEVNAERFINSMKNDNFDYTEWQRNLWNDKTIDEIHNAAAAYYSSKSAAYSP
jgi:hypothetical protein